MPRRRLLATGSYLSTGGLTTWWWDGATGLQPAGRADVDVPSFVCWHPRLPLLYAVSELGQGSVSTVAVGSDGSLSTVATTPTGGAEPCWVTTDPAAMALLVANYDLTGGAASMAVIALGADGLPAGAVLLSPHRGSGPRADRQATAHVHQVVPTANGTVLAADLGSDELVEYRIDEVVGAAPGQLAVSEMGRVAMPAGSGPRHIALAADGVTGFVSCELDGTVAVIRRELLNGGGFGPWAVTRQVACGEYPSHVGLAGLDRYLLVANRGPSTLSVLDVSADLEPVSEVPVPTWPRHFTVAEDANEVAILVAGQRGERIELLRLDPATGEVTAAGELRSGGGVGPATAPAVMPTVSCLALRPLGQIGDGDGGQQ